MGGPAARRIDLEDSLDAINDDYYARGWTDGLPIIPPTEARVQRMLAGTRRAPADLIGVMPPHQGQVTVEKVAVNAVMAGCLPSYLPVLLTAVEIVCEPSFNLYGLQATTNPGGPMLILNGPVRQELDVNCGHGCLGPGRRANASIGRAVRLCLVNLGGAVPGIADKATHGFPGKYSFCFGENEEESPWEPLHQERGQPKETSAVTVGAAAGTDNILDSSDSTADGLLTTLASGMKSHGSNPMVHPGAYPTLVMSPEHAIILAREGLTKADARQQLWERTGVPLEAFSPELLRKRISKDRGNITAGLARPLVTPEDLTVVVAGGAGAHSVWVNTFSCPSVTRPIGV